MKISKTLLSTLILGAFLLSDAANLTATKMPKKEKEVKTSVLKTMRYDAFTPLSQQKSIKELPEQLKKPESGLGYIDTKGRPPAYGPVTGIVPPWMRK